MEWHLDRARPICPQLAEQLCVCIARGEFPPGSRLLSVREVAVAAGVNPNTVQRAFEQLERSGLLYSVRGSGWFVGTSDAVAHQAVRTLMAEKTDAYMDQMAALGLTPKEIRRYIEERTADDEEEEEI